MIRQLSLGLVVVCQPAANCESIVTVERSFAITDLHADEKLYPSIINEQSNIILLYFAQLQKVVKVREEKGLSEKYRLRVKLVLLRKFRVLIGHNFILIVCQSIGPFAT